MSTAPASSSGTLDTHTIASNPQSRYFLIKSYSNENIVKSNELGVWATSQRNEKVLGAAFQTSPYVVLVFSVNNSSRFSGFAVVTSAPGQSQREGKPVFFGPDGSPFPGKMFDVVWVRSYEIFFRDCESILNSYNSNKPVKVGRDGQEIEPGAGKELCELIEKRFKQSSGSFRTRGPITASPNTTQSSSLTPASLKHTSSSPPQQRLVDRAADEDGGFLHPSKRPRLTTEFSNQSRVNNVPTMSNEVPTPSHTSQTQSPSPSASVFTNGLSTGLIQRPPQMSSLSLPSFKQLAEVAEMLKSQGKIGLPKKSLEPAPTNIPIKSFKEETLPCDVPQSYVPQSYVPQSYVPLESGTQSTTSQKSIEESDVIISTEEDLINALKGLDSSKKQSVPNNLLTIIQKPLNFDWVEEKLIENPVLTLFPLDLTDMSYEEYRHIYETSKLKWDILQKFGSPPPLPHYLQLSEKEKLNFDASVYLRLYADSLLQGNGIVFNDSKEKDHVTSNNISLMNQLPPPPSQMIMSQLNVSH